MSPELNLLPCPFCGHGEPELERVGSGRQSCIVACGNCGARHESSDEWEESGTSWNCRAQPAAAPPMHAPCATCGRDYGDHDGTRCPTGVASHFKPVTATRCRVPGDERDACDNAVIEHLGPAALAGGKMSVYEAFHLGWKARAALAAPAAPQEPVAHRLLRRNGDGEWVNDAKHWADGAPPRELVLACENNPGLYRVEYAVATPAAQAAHHELTDYKAMFQQAVSSLAAISEALGIPDDEAATGEPEIIIDHIRELKRERDEWVDAGYAIAAEAVTATMNLPMPPWDECYGTPFTIGIYPGSPEIWIEGACGRQNIPVEHLNSVIRQLRRAGRLAAEHSEAGHAN